jgi:hypothetical protein
MWRAGYLRTTHYLLLSTQGPSVAASVRRRLGRAGYPITATLITVAVIGICAGAIIDVTMIREAGSKAVWEGNFSPAPVNRR